MPLEIPTHNDAVITPWLWGLLPDNSAVLERWASHFSVSASSPFSILSSPVGQDCAGAVQFLTPEAHAKFEINEFLCLTAANLLKINAAKSELLNIEGETALMIERFDRAPTTIEHRLMRVHQEDLCQALGVHPSRKYESEGGPGITALNDLFDRVFTTTHARAARLVLLDAIIFNWLICGTDAHAKNYGLLLEKDEVRLAPLYDIASALPYEVP